MIETQVCEDSYIADGLTTPRAIGFPIVSPAEMVVTVDDAVQPLNGTYRITGDYAAGEGVIEPLSTWPLIAGAGAVVRYYRDTALVQRYDPNAGQALQAESLERELDRQIQALQEARAVLRRALLAPAGETLAGLPSKTHRVGKYLSFDANGDPVLSTGTVIGGDGTLRADLALQTGVSLVGTVFGTLKEKLDAEPYLDSGRLLIDSDSVDQTADLIAYLNQCAALGMWACLKGKVRVTQHTIPSAVTIKGVRASVYYDGPAGPGINNVAGVFHFTEHGTGLVADNPFDFQFFGNNAVLNVAAARHNGRKGVVSKNIRCYNLNLLFCIPGTPGTNTAIGYDTVVTDEATGNCCRDVFVENGYCKFDTQKSLISHAAAISLQYVQHARVNGEAFNNSYVVAVGGKANLSSEDPITGNPGQGELPVYDGSGNLIGGFERKCKRIYVEGGEMTNGTGAVVFIMVEDSWSDRVTGKNGSDVLFDLEGCIRTYHKRFKAHDCNNTLLACFFYNKDVGFIDGEAIQSVAGRFLFRLYNSYVSADNPGPITIAGGTYKCTAATGAPGIIGHSGADPVRTMRIIGLYTEHVRFDVGQNNMHDVEVRANHMVFPVAYTAAAFDAIGARVFTYGGIHGSSLVKDNVIQFRAAMHAGTRAIRQANSSNPAKIKTIGNIIEGLPAGNIIELDQNAGLGGLFVTLGNIGEAGNTIGQNQNGGSAATFTKPVNSNVTTANVSM